VTVFSWPARVYWEDTDGGGIVYYANYLKYLERARTEWLRALGFSQQALAAEQGILFTVVSLAAEYRRPARLDDALEVTCEPAVDGGATLRFKQRVLRGDELLLCAQVRVACIDARTMRPRRLPAFLTSVLAPGGRAA
jgi:acyl-CoA thioester hydrolase